MLFTNMLQDKTTKRMKLYSDKYVPSCPNCKKKNSVWAIDSTGKYFKDDWDASPKFRYAIFIETGMKIKKQTLSSEERSRINGVETAGIYFCSYCYEVGYKLEKLKE